VLLKCGAFTVNAIPDTNYTKLIAYYTPADFDTVWVGKCTQVVSDCAHYSYNFDCYVG
jgi:hypothetical protein